MTFVNRKKRKDISLNKVFQSGFSRDLALFLQGFRAKVLELVVQKGLF